MVCLLGIQEVANWEHVDDCMQWFLAVELANELFVGEGGNVVDSSIGRFQKHLTQGQFVSQLAAIKEATNHQFGLLVC
jgi:hypothetical protein